MLKLIAGALGLFAIAGGVSMVAFQTSEWAVPVTANDSAFVSDCTDSFNQALGRASASDVSATLQNTNIPLLGGGIVEKCRCIEKELTADLSEHEADTVLRLTTLSYRIELLKHLPRGEERRTLRKEARAEMQDVLIHGDWTPQEAGELAKRASYGGMACFR